MTTLERYTQDKTNTLVAAFVFLFSLAVYTITMTPTVPFWDSGEFIATSYILGVPHAPGTPLYVLIGRLFTLIPIATIAERVNWFSSLSSAVAVVFTYLVTVKLSRKIFPWEARPMNRPLAYVAGVVGALTAGFAATFWDNAIEAEVYAASCALMVFVVWLALRWEERLDRGNEDGLLLLITYLVGLGIGIHLGVAIAAWAAVVFVFATRPSYIWRWDYFGWGVATLSLATGIHWGAFLVAPVVLVITLLIWVANGKFHKLAFWSAFLFMVGVSVHFYLLIRSNLHPMINEAAPENLHSLWLMLIRDQYKPPPIWERKADFWYQFNHMYLRYMRWNFTLFFLKGRDFFQLPILLAVAGAIIHFMKARRTAILLGVLFLLLGPAMVVYLNFKVGEVRERDYFFVQNFQFMSIWVGIGAAWLVTWVAEQFSNVSTSRAAAGATAAVMVVMGFAPVATNWRSHDRRGFYVARDYAYNMLIGLKPNAIIFTNGDNDTFPLWYLQEVEKIRKDVRVVNLSLLNTDWYIKQLRDLSPKVPIGWTDAQLEQIQPYRDQNGKIWYVKDIAVKQIVKENDWKRPLYLAVTVPDQMGLDKQVVMEGLVFRIEPKPTPTDLDVEKTLKNLNQVYEFKGLVLRDTTADGTVKWLPDSTVYKDENASKLVQNYAAAFSRLGVSLFEAGKTQEALDEMEKAEAVSPDFPGIPMAKLIFLERLGRIDEAEAFGKRMIKRYPQNWQFYQRLGQILLDHNRVEQSIQYFEEASRVAPDEYYPYQGLVSAYYKLGRYQDALTALQRLADQHPEDTSIVQYISELRESMRTGKLLPGMAPDTTAQADTTGGGDTTAAGSRTAAGSNGN